MAETARRIFAGHLGHFTAPRLNPAAPNRLCVREMSFGMSRSGSRWQRRRLKELTASFIPYFRLISHEAPTPSACPPPRPFPVRQQRIRTDIHGSRLVAGDRSATALPPHTASPRRVGIASLSTSVWALGYRMACPVMRTVVAPSISSAGFRWISGYVGAIPGSLPCTYLMRDDISTASAGNWRSRRVAPGPDIREARVSDSSPLHRYFKRHYFPLEATSLVAPARCPRVRKGMSPHARCGRRRRRLPG